MRHKAEWWAGPVAELAASGDARAVARRHGVTERTLIWWRSELRKRSREVPAQRLLPVVVRRAPQRATAVRSPDGLEVFVEIGTARMTLRGEVTAEHLAAIVTASSRAC
jgi:transposase-like protein